MQRVSRSIFASLLVIAGLTACGDKVTVAPSTGGNTGTTTPQVHGVTVSPSSVSLKIGESVTLVASVNADAGLARTVTWASSDATKASVSSTGTVKALASGTVVITATSTADATQAGAATIVIAPVTAATISISTINQGGLPANLNAVAGQLDVTLNIDQGTQTINSLALIVHNNTTNTDTTVATYTYSSNKAPDAKAAAAPVTMSFNTAAFNSTTGAVNFLNGSYSIKAQANVAGGTQSPVSSTINYTLTNADFIGVKATATNTGSDAAGLQWIGGTVSINVVPVMYNGVAMKTVTVAPDPTDVIAAPVTLSTLPGTASFSAGTKDTLTYPAYTPIVTGVYQNGTAFAGFVTPLAGSLTTPFKVDWQAPAAPATFWLKGGNSQWLNGTYAFGNSTDYKLVAAPTDPGSPAGPGSGAVASKAQFWAFPTASFTALGAAKSGAACKTAGGTQVTTGSSLAQSAPADSTTYSLRVLQFDNVGNVVCADLPKTFGVDLTAPVNVASTGGSNLGTVNPLLKGTNKGYSNADFSAITVSAVDSISGFDATPVTLSSTILPTSGTSACALAGPPSPCSVTNGFAIASATWSSASTEGYYTVGASVADRAGNSVALPTKTYAIDKTAPGGSGGVAIPAALVGGTAVSLSGTVTDNLTLMGAGGAATYNAAGITLNYDGYATLASAGTFGTLNKTATATMGIPWLISDLQVGNGAGHGVDSLKIRGVDEVGLSGGFAITIPAANITTGAGNGHSATNGEWDPSNFTGWAMSNPATTTVSLSGTGGPSSVPIAATVTIPNTSQLGLPFSKVCFYYLDNAAATTAATPAFSAEYKQIDCVSAAATSDNTNWVYNYGAWTPPAAIANYGGTIPGANTTKIIAIGFGVNGHASLTTAASGTITVTP
jgi:hypothetical protein